MKWRDRRRRRRRRRGCWCYLSRFVCFKIRGGEREREVEGSTGLGVQEGAELGAGDLLEGVVCDQLAGAAEQEVALRRAELPDHVWLL